MTLKPDSPRTWTKVFRGEPRQVSQVRDWIEELFPGSESRDDLVLIAVELATNAVKFTRSGQEGWFAVEITWLGMHVRVAVADGGAPIIPQLINDPMAENGRGLLMIQALSSRFGVSGDQRGRVVWADLSWQEQPAVSEAGIVTLILPAAAGEDRSLNGSAVAASGHSVDAAERAIGQALAAAGRRAAEPMPEDEIHRHYEEFLRRLREQQEREWVSFRSQLLMIGTRVIDSHVNHNGWCKRCGIAVPFPCPQARRAEFMLGSF